MKNKKLKKIVKKMERNCPTCGTEMKEKVGSLNYPINGEDIQVSHMSHLCCQKCGEIVLRLDEARRLREGGVEIYRKKYHLLSAEEIRSLRERLGLTQGDLADLLRFGVNSISRWENGKNVQTAAMDILLRLIRDIPENIDYLRKLAA